jgi:hypothetical protein
LAALTPTKERLQLQGDWGIQDTVWTLWRREGCLVLSEIEPRSLVSTYGSNNKATARDRPNLRCHALHVVMGRFSGDWQPVLATLIGRAVMVGLKGN